MTVETEIQRWHCHDVQIRTNQEVGSPFEAQAAGRFVHQESGRELRLPGFYEGDGVWVVRFSPDIEGLWSYEAQVATDGENVVEARGAIHCVPNTNDRIHGKLRIDPEQRQAFRYEDGTSYILVGYEADWLFALDLEHEQLIRTEPFLDKIADSGFNHIVMNVYAHANDWGQIDNAGNYDYSKPPMWPFGGTNDEPDYRTINTSFFKKLDLVIGAMQSRGLVAHLMIYVWNKRVNWPGSDSPEDNRYFDYVVSRYQAYSNVVWDIAKEALAYGHCNSTYIAGRIDRLRKLDAYSTLLTVHSSNFCNQHLELIDFYSIQCWSSSLYTVMRQLAVKHADMPIYNIEHGGYEEGPYRLFEGDFQDAKVCLQRNYECMFAGVYSTYYWQNSAWNIIIHDVSELEEAQRPKYSYFANMNELFTKYAYNELRPASGLSQSGYSLASEHGCYLFLKPYGGKNMGITLPHADNGYMAVWFNPFTGETQAAGSYGRMKWERISSPWGIQMAVLVVEARTVVEVEAY
jgi:hypothetical protein